MLFVPTAELRLVADNQSGVRPAASYGTSVTPGNNTYSSYTSLLSATSEEAHWVVININSIGTSATATDTLVTIGGIQSNHCRATAAVAARTGLRCSLILSGVPPSKATGNLLLDTLLGADVAFVPSREERAPAMQATVARLASSGAACVRWLPVRRHRPRTV